MDRAEMPSHINFKFSPRNPDVSVRVATPYSNSPVQPARPSTSGGEYAVWPERISLGLATFEVDVAVEKFRHRTSVLMLL
jgi:hypothetical protein